MNSNQQHERELETFLEQDHSPLAALYRKLPHSEPDENLDATVLAMAHRALNPELPRRITALHRLHTRWIPALAAAASLVLVAGIAWRLDSGGLHNTGENMNVPGDMSASPRGAISNNAAKDTEQESQKADDVAKPFIAPTAIPAPSRPMSAGDSAENKKAIAVDIRQQKFAPATATAPAPLAVSRAKAAATPQALQMESAASATPPGAASDSALAASAQAVESPEHWITRIRNLLHEQQYNEAVLSLQDFHKQYPDYKLPDDLRKLMQ